MKKVLFFLFSFISISVFGQHSTSDVVLDLMANYHEIQPQITYLEIDGQELKVDVYRSRDHLGEDPWYLNDEPKQPTLIYIHGGGWVALDKATVTFKFLPYLEKGWTVVNVNYRLGFPMQPAMVDTRCALNWVYENADEYGFDLDRLVLSGASAGGHLSLITGMKNKDYFDSPCDIREDLKVAAIVNWFGVADMEPYLYDFKKRLGDEELAEEIHAKASPIHYIHQDTPPIITIHGSEDKVVDFSQAQILHNGLEKAGLEHELHVVEGGKHGGFTAKELGECFEAIWAFLDMHMELNN